jgi:hypothetical protein
MVASCVKNTLSQLTHYRQMLWKRPFLNLNIPSQELMTLNSPASHFFLPQQIVASVRRNFFSGGHVTPAMSKKRQAFRFEYNRQSIAVSISK